jgi:hypothetical protein
MAKAFKAQIEVRGGVRQVFLRSLITLKPPVRWQPF